MSNFFKNLKERLSPKQFMLLKIGGPLVAAAIVVVVVIAVQNPAAIQELETELADEIESIVEEDPVEEDLVANALASGEFQGTVLELTPDAGTAYVKETLFIGDSNTAGMILNSSTTNVSMDNGIGIVSMGVAHVTSLRCVKFRGMEAVAVPEAVKILQPRRIVITYGTNDFYMKPEKFAEEYKKALDAIKQAYPYSDIIIGSIFPITSNCSYYTVSQPVIDKFNLELVKLAKEKKVYFLNWSDPMKDPKTGYCKPEYMSGDGVHLSKKGMEVIFEYFRTHKLDSEDKRPKPLNPIPVREPTPPGLLGGGPRTPVEEEPEVEESGLVTVSVVAGEGGSLGGGNITLALPPGATVNLPNPIPNAGYEFAGWSGAATVPSGVTSYTIVATFKLTTPDTGDGDDPGSGDPGSGDPGSGDPGSGDPGSGDPGSGDPGGGGEPPGDGGDG